MKPWKTRSRATILNHSKFLVVESHTVELPDGRIIEDWPWLVTPDYVNVVAVTPDDRFICFRQTKYAVKEVSLAVVGGYMEPGEAPLAAAKRELLEEAGYEAAEWTGLGQYRVDSNRGAGMAHLFLARGAVYAGRVVSDDLEEQELLLLSQAEVEAALLEGQFKVLAWTAAVALALRYMGR
jgi:8-oxo-dGTP pyrophosphatase MutT (NUDIX family)